MAQQQTPKLSDRTGNTILFADEEEFDRTIKRWAAILLSRAPELASGLEAVQDMKCNGKKPDRKIEINGFAEEERAMQFLAANEKSVGRLSAHAILKMEHGYVMDRLVQAIKEKREE